MNKVQTLLAALLLGMMLAGCGSDGGSDGDVASASGTSKNEAKDEDGTSEGDRQDKALEFAKCMRENGVEMDDPKGGRITIKGGPGDQEAMEKAQEACQKYLPPISAEDRKKGGENALKFSQCMRENGVEEFPDPKGGMMRVDKGLTDDPDFEKAQQACRKLMGGPAATSSDKA